MIEHPITPVQEVTDFEVGDPIVARDMGRTLYGVVAETDFENAVSDGLPILMRVQICRYDGGKTTSHENEEWDVWLYDHEICYRLPMTCYGPYDGPIAELP